MEHYYVLKDKIYMLVEAKVIQLQPQPKQNKVPTSKVTINVGTGEISAMSAAIHIPKDEFKVAYDPHWTT